MKSKNLILISFFSTCMIFTSFGQTWEWSNQNSQKDASAWSFIMDIDYHNNIYTGTQYGDSIFFGDTIFAHENYYDWANWAIAKYDNQGNFQGAIDISTLPDKTIFDVKLATDKDMNMYISGEFQHLVYLLDTTIYHGNTVYPDMPDLFIAKVAPSLNIEWIQLVSSTSQDQCLGLLVSPDQYLYMATKHSGFAGNTDTAIYLGQDTAIFESSLCSILKIDLSGNIKWRNELHTSSLEVSVREINFDIYNHLTVNGYLKNDLYYTNDTIFHPHPGEFKYRSFILEIDTSGGLISGLIPDWYLVMADTDRDAFGNFYFAGFIWDTVYFANDTLIQYEDSTMNIIAKLNSDFEPIWYETASAKSEQGSYYFHIDLDQDTLFFAGRCRGAFPMFDTIFGIGGYEALIGQVTPNGELDKVIVTETTGGFKPFGLKLDNCNNIIVSGQFRGYTHFGQDTIESYSYAVWDGITAKLERYEFNGFSFGPDTTVCESITLLGPEGYQYYYWNDSLSTHNWINITETGEYVFACTNDGGCWIRDTINITVQPGFTINLGQDTTITLQDTITLSVPNTYESYLWSTGSNGNSIDITGNTFGPGNWDIWVKVTQGVCIVTDTIQLTITISVPEIKDIGFKVYPNPTSDVFYVSLSRDIEKIEVVDLRGKIIYMQDKRELLNHHLKIDLSSRPSGLYYIRIYFNNLVGNCKIIRL